ncbi:hypothetical protein FXO38_21613 [Capsicum annuum]|nr:hypothetical protein FXO38_21613 [Capsicum annuum]
MNCFNPSSKDRSKFEITRSGADIDKVIHARWAMLGTAGFIFPKAFNKFGVNCASEAVWFKTRALILDGNTLNYFGKNIPINLVLVIVVEVVLVGSAEYYRIINGLVSSPITITTILLLRIEGLRLHPIRQVDDAYYGVNELLLFVKALLHAYFAERATSKREESTEKGRSSATSAFSVEITPKSRGNAEILRGILRLGVACAPRICQCFSATSALDLGGVYDYEKPTSEKLMEVEERETLVLVRRGK